MTGPLKSNWKPGDQMTPGDVNAMAAAINNGPSVEWQIYAEGPPELWRQRNTRTGAWIGEPRDVVAAFGVTGVVSSAMEVLVQNPESSISGAINREATTALSAGAPGVTRQVDARGNLGIARPAWLGIIQWLINQGDPNPINWKPGDQVCPAETVEAPWTPHFLLHKLDWFNAESLSLGNGAAVPTWADLSGNGSDLTQATPGARPVMVTAGIGGRKSVQFDGSDDYLRGTIANPYSNPFITYLVCQATASSNASGSDYVVGDSATSPTALVSAASIFRSTGLAYGIARGSSVTGATAGAWDTTPKLIKAVFNGASSSLDANLVNQLTGATGTTSAPVDTITLGGRGDLAASAFWQGLIAERIRVSSISGSDETKLLTHLNSKYSLGLTI